ncbi:hypothetical protein GCWU000321_01777 [Dialister invisus DSM 15470]|uniref:Uncharacterized protein n=1 Tax=Dialister invisus DSM 15470 TaxID=592028 RepID=C9LQE5_9FIRM|nr:hypothetical protein GCWU000321_01777 [Dialister invisus DSM 15470]
MESFRNVYHLNIFDLYILFIFYIEYLGISVIPLLNRNYIFSGNAQYVLRLSLP